MRSSFLPLSAMLIVLGFYPMLCHPLLLATWSHSSVWARLSRVLVLGFLSTPRFPLFSAASSYALPWDVCSSHPSLPLALGRLLLFLSFGCCSYVSLVLPSQWWGSVSSMLWPVSICCEHRLRSDYVPFCVCFLFFSFSFPKGCSKHRLSLPSVTPFYAVHYYTVCFPIPRPPTPRESREVH